MPLIVSAAGAAIARQIGWAMLMQIVRRSRIFGSASALFVLALGVVEAQAEPITFNFTATVDSVEQPLAGAFSIGQLVSGSFTFESTVADDDDEAWHGLYRPSVAEPLSFNIGSYSVTNGPRSAIHIFNDDGGIGDAIRLIWSTPVGAAVGDLSPIQFLIELEDVHETVFSSDALPSSFSLAEFETRSWRLAFADFSPRSGTQISGTVTSVELASADVPEPTSVTLLGTGLLAVVAQLRRRRRDSQTRGIS